MFGCFVSGPFDQHRRADIASFGDEDVVGAAKRTDVHHFQSDAGFHQ
jgi:hypothetical protein